MGVETAAAAGVGVVKAKRGVVHIVKLAMELVGDLCHSP